jgi:hypothetical protein
VRFLTAGVFETASKFFLMAVFVVALPFTVFATFPVTSRELSASHSRFASVLATSRSLAESDHGAPGVPGAAEGSDGLLQDLRDGHGRGPYCSAR